ncbi:MAG: hypothetical protein KDC34_16305, partial [Saprospiraceae bacterium]|nr:hypothetical protein [Saprospiraceae bacterium]
MPKKINYGFRKTEISRKATFFSFSISFLISLLIIGLTGGSGTDEQQNKVVGNQPEISNSGALVNETKGAGKMMIPGDLPWAGESCNGETFILQSGIAVLTCGVTTAVPQPERYAFAMINVDGALPASGRLDVSASQAAYHHPSWHIDEIGNVYGVAMNQRTGETFIAASSNYGSGYFGQPGIVRYGNIGGGANSLAAAGTVYRIDPVSGQASVFAVLPQQASTFTHTNCETGEESAPRTTGPGLGNIIYDVYRNQFFVSNAEDGRIYRLDAAGNVVDSYDPLTYDDGTAGVSIFTEQPYGLALEPGGDRLFFGTAVAPNGGNSPGTGDVPIYSIDLNANGSFVGTVDNTILPAGVSNNYVGTETFHTNIGVGSSTGCTFAENSSYMISDLQFGNPGELLVGVRVSCDGNWYGSYNHWGGTVLVTLGGGSLYNGSVAYYNISVTGDCGDDDGYGGVAIWEPVSGSGNIQYIVTSADILAEVGPHGIAVFNGTASTGGSPIDPLGVMSYGLVDSGDPKGVGGDVDVYNGCLPNCSEPIIVVSCDPNGTVDPADDQFFYTIEIPASGTPGNSYSISADDTQTNLPYDAVNGPFGPFPVSDGDLVLTIIDDDNQGCLSVVSVAAPTECPFCMLNITDVDYTSCVAGTFDLTLTLDWADAPAGDFEYSIDGGSTYTTIVKDNPGANVVGETVTIPGLPCDDVELLEFQFIGNSDCQAEVLFMSSPTDPAGYIYCEGTGDIITGGTISVVPPANGNVSIIEDGSNGYYEWVAFGSPVVAGIYTMSYTPPAGYTLTGTPGGFGDGNAVLDPTGGSGDNPLSLDPLLLGSDVNMAGTILLDSDLSANPFFYNINLAPGDPYVALNNIPLTCPCTLSPVILATCDDQGTTDPTDDTFSYTIEIPASMHTGSSYSISGDDTQNNLSYDQENGSFGPFLITDGNLNITISDDDNPGCSQAEVVTAPTECSDCVLANPVIVTTCNNEGTTDPTDDTFTFTIEVNETTGLGSTYSLTGDVTSSNLPYGTVQGTYGPFLIVDGDLTITITDDGDAACLISNETVSAPMECSDCNLSGPIVVVSCNNQGTFDQADDTYSYTIQVDETEGLGVTYSITGDDSHAALSYGVVEGPFGPFLLSDGDLTITITDDGDGACQLANELIAAPAPCPPDADFGDLPDDNTTGSYPTDLTNGAGEGEGACHVIVPGMKLGTDVDEETDGAPSMMADGDDNDGNDDETGVIAPAMIVAGQAATFNITAMNMTGTGADAFVVGFIDWNNDGDFGDAEEVQTSGALFDGYNNNFNMTFNVPVGAVLNTKLGARFRLGTVLADISEADGCTTDGEVEDYTVVVMGFDYGDLADSGAGSSNGNYETLSANNGPSHKIITDDQGNLILKIGNDVDADVNGQPSATAVGDDSAGNDDEDGVSLPQFTAGIPSTFDVSVMNMTQQVAKLTIFIDWNGNGLFEASEMYAQDIAIGQTVASFTITPPYVGLFTNNVGVRIRLSTDAAISMSPTGQAPDGEVEDYLALIDGYDYGDLNDLAQGGSGAPIGTPADYQTLNADNGACHKILIDNNGNQILKIGASVDAESDGQPQAEAGQTTGGDDNNAANGVGPNDEDGLNYATLPLFILTQTTTLNIPVMNMTGELAKLTVYIDFNKNGVFTDAGEMFFVDVLNGQTTATVNIPVPVNAVVGDDVGLRIRLNDADEGMSPVGVFQSGEVEDYMVQIVGFDFGDLPDSYTTTGPDAPRHIVNENLKIGSCVDTEIDGIPNAMAGLMTGGDDGDAGLATFGTCDEPGDDEDGIEFITPMVPGTTACVEVNAMNMTGSSAVLQAWIDFNGNGTFEANEELTSGSFSTAGVTVPDGAGLVNAELCFEVPADATFTGGQAMSRWRLSPNGGLGSDGPNGGPYPFGEVEDHKAQLAKIGNYVWNDSNGDGQQNEPAIGGLNDVDIQLTWAGANGIFGDSDDEVYQTTTSNMGVNGMYMFNGLIPGAYKVAVIDGPGQPTQIEVGGPYTDSNDPAGTMVMIPDPVNLPLGENGTGDNPNDPVYPDPNNDLSIDFGFIFLDHGDLPDTYGTTDNNNGPAHIVNPRLKLGTCVDSDEDGQPEAMAGMMQGGDDNDSNSEMTEGVCEASGDDEDGIEFITPMVPGSTACVEVSAMNSTGQDAVLQGWIDWNGNGSFQGGEQLTTLDFSGGGAVIPDDGVMSITLCFEVPDFAVFADGQAMTRWRLSPDGGQSPTGPDSAPYTIGEVEDHKVQLAKIGNLVWNDYNNDGIQNEPGDAGLNGIDVQLVWPGLNAVFGDGDDVTYTVTTSNMNGVDGMYMILGLTPGMYKLSVPTNPVEYIPTMIDQTDDDEDSDDPTGVMVIINDPIDLPLLENGTGDVPNDPNFPDQFNDLTYDFGY